MLILTFEDSEEEFLNQIISFVGTGTRTFQTVEQETLEFEGLEIDDTKRLVKKNNQEVELTYTEFEILYLLASSPGRCLAKSKSMILYGKNPIPVITILS